MLQINTKTRLWCLLLACGILLVLSCDVYLLGHTGWCLWYSQEIQQVVSALPPSLSGWTFALTEGFWVSDKLGVSLIHKWLWNYFCLLQTHLRLLYAVRMYCHHWWQMWEKWSAKKNPLMHSMFGLPFESPKKFIFIFREIKQRSNTIFCWI